MEKLREDAIKATVNATVKATEERVCKALEKPTAIYKDLERRGADLGNARKRLQAEVDKYHRSIAESEARCVLDTETEIAKVRAKFVKQHESRVKAITKSRGDDYENAQENLEKVEAGIKENENKKDELVRETRYGCAMEEAGVQFPPSPETRTKPEDSSHAEDMSKAEKVFQKDLDSSRHGSAYRPGKTEVTNTLPLDSVPFDGEDMVPDNSTPVHPRFATIVKIQGEWRELHCFLCGANALQSGALFPSIQSLLAHIISHHDRDKKMPTPERLERCSKSSDRVFSNADIEEMLKGNDPPSGAIIVVPQPGNQKTTVKQQSQSKAAIPHNPMNPRSPYEGTMQSPRNSKPTAAVARPTRETRADTPPNPHHRTRAKANRKVDELRTIPNISKLPKPSRPLNSPAGVLSSPSMTTDEDGSTGTDTPTRHEPEPEQRGRGVRRTGAVDYYKKVW